MANMSCCFLLTCSSCLKQMLASWDEAISWPLVAEFEPDGPSALHRFSCTVPLLHKSEKERFTSTLTSRSSVAGVERAVAQYSYFEEQTLSDCGVNVILSLSQFY
eukprot:scaffold65954_cov47-Prasinocladus_malaysianus.AAC.3